MTDVFPRSAFKDVPFHARIEVAQVNTFFDQLPVHDLIRTRVYDIDLVAVIGPGAELHAAQLDVVREEFHVHLTR